MTAKLGGGGYSVKDPKFFLSCGNCSHISIRRLLIMNRSLVFILTENNQNYKVCIR